VETGGDGGRNVAEDTAVAHVMDKLDALAAAGAAQDAGLQEVRPPEGVRI
jgi:hypothetical protein